MGMGELNELFVGVKGKDYILAKIDDLCQKYNNRNGVGYNQQRALFRSYCHDTIAAFDDCFEGTMLGIIRCKNKVEAYYGKDNVDIGIATLDIVNMLVELKSIVKSMTPIKDLPSCKKILALSAEDIASKAKDLVKNDIVKAGAGIILFGAKVHDVVKIEDVRGFYNECLEELMKEIQIKGGCVSPMEQFLIEKFNAEIGYCNLALLKAGLGMAEELKDLAEIAKKNIERFENQQADSNNNIYMITNH